MKLLVALLMLATLSACSLPVFFRVPVVQGNVVTAKEVDKLKLGMTKRQVKYVLGTPLIKTPFEKDRWDYVFYYRNPRAHVRRSKLDLYFKHGKLNDIEGSEEYTAQIMKNAHGSPGGSLLPGQAGTSGARQNGEAPGLRNPGGPLPR